MQQDKAALKRTRFGISAIYFTTGLTFASWASRIPDIQQLLGLSNGQLGSVLFSIPFGQLFMMALSGYLVGRFGSRVTTIFSATMYSLVLFCISLTTNYITLCLCLAAFGAMANFINIAINTQAVFLEKMYGRNIMSNFHGLWSLGGFLGGIIGTGFANTSLSISWHYAFVMAVCMLIIYFNKNHLVRQESKNNSETPHRKFSLTTIDGIIIVLGIMCFGGMFCEGTVYDWSSVYFASVVKPDASLVRAGYVVGMGTMTCGRFFADHFVSKYGASRVLLVCGFLIVCGLQIAIVWPMLIPATLGFLLVGFGISSIVPICYSLAGTYSTMQASTAITIVSSISFLGFLIGPPIIGWMAEVTNLRISLGVASTFGLFIVILSRIVNKRIQAINGSK